MGRWEILIPKVPYILYHGFTNSASTIALICLRFVEKFDRDLVENLMENENLVEDLTGNLIDAFLFFSVVRGSNGPGGGVLLK